MKTSNDSVKRSLQGLVIHAFLFLVALMVPASVFAQACPSGTTSYYLGTGSPSGYTYTSPLTWASGSLGPATFTFADGFTVTLQFTGANYIDTAQGIQYPSMQNLAGRSSLEIDHRNSPSGANLSTLNVTTSAATLSNSLVTEDIDYAAGQYRDKFTASAGATWTPVNSGNYTIAGTTITANNGVSCNGTAACNATAAWVGGTAHSVTYQNGLGAASGLQATSYNAFQFCRAKLTLRKQWSGALTNDAATLTAKVSGTTIESLSSTATTPNTLTTDTSPATVSPGDAIVIAETFPGGNAGVYGSALACSGSSGLSGQTLTVGAADTAIVCTYTNTRNQNADLSITKKTNTSPVVSGQPVSYTVIVTNAGPATATGVVVKDSPVSGLTCPPANTVTCSGTGCPGGAITLGNLLSPGVTMGTMVAGTSATLTYFCTAN